MNGKPPVPPIMYWSIQREDFISFSRKCSCRKE